MTQPDHSRRGRLKVFLSYAAGAGKTYRMIEEAQELKKQGADVVVGYFEPHGRKDTIEKIEGLEIIPRRKIEYRGVEFEEMDTGAILRRAPQICVVDEFPHTNVPGAERAKRWEDVSKASTIRSGKSPASVSARRCPIGSSNRRTRL